jgi:uncharacterized protein YcaQ
VATQLGVVQIDAVNVLVRSHYLPHFARLGPYDMAALDRLVYRDHEMFEYPGHAASLMTTDHHPLMRWRMEAHRAQRWEPTSVAIEKQRPGYIEAVKSEIAARGPLSWTDLSDAGREEKRPTKYAESSIAWWRWSVGKDVLTHLALVGELAIAGRRNFEALYDLAERVLPAGTLERPTPSEADAHRELVRRSVVALGVGSGKDIADYYRLPVATTKARLKELLDAEVVDAVRVEGWKEPAWMVRGARPPRACSAHALLSPFDSLIWERKRAERIFGFKVSFEIYVPPPKRIYGYFVLAFLMGEEIVARVDLKADRRRRVLLVPGAFLEPGQPAGGVAESLITQLAALAQWLDLDVIEVGERGDLIPTLKAVANRR